MTDLPYTDSDLRAEAARQLSSLTEDPDYMGVGERMEYSAIASTQDNGTARTWDSALRDNSDDYEDFVIAQQKVHDLITGAADTSDWAVSLGADRLVPDGHTIQIGATDSSNEEEATVRLHFAFRSDMNAADRDRFIVRLTQVISDHL